MSRASKVMMLTLALSLTGGCAATPLHAEVPEGVIRGPMLARISAGGVTVAWQTGKARAGAVRYGKTQDCASRQGAAAEAVRQAVALTGLEPRTTYHYYVELDGKRATPIYSFKTAPRGAARFTFALLGDSGKGNRAQHQVGKAILAAGPDLVIHGGDLVYSRGEDKHYGKRFFEPYRKLLATTPFYPCLGNHDYGTQRGQPYLDNLVLPSDNEKGTERYYSFRYGDAGFICLDSNMFGIDFALSGQRKWLKQRLASKDWKGWTFAFFHHPLYSVKKGRMRGAAARRGKIAPLLEAGRVDLVLCGHDHYYHRTHPVSQTRKWTMVHLTSGAAGASLYEGKPQKFTAAFKSAYHYVWVDVESASTLYLEAREVDIKTGKVTVIDKVKLTRTENGVRVW